MYIEKTLYIQGFPNMYTYMHVYIYIYIYIYIYTGFFPLGGMEESPLPPPAKDLLIPHT